MKKELFNEEEKKIVNKIEELVGLPWEDFFPNREKKISKSNAIKALRKMLEDEIVDMDYEIGLYKDEIQYSYESLKETIEEIYSNNKEIERFNKRKANVNDAKAKFEEMFKE